MNILLVTMEMQVGGAETHVLELAKELNRRNHQVYVMSAGGKYAEILKNEGISHMYAPLKDKKPANMMKSYQLIKQIVKEKNIEVVHAHARIPAFIAGKACKSLKIPFVTTVHGIYKVNFLLKCLSNWGQKTLAVSEDIKDQIVRDYQLDPANVGITVNGINTQEFCKGYQSEIAKELGIAKEKFHIIHVSRLDKESSNLAKMLVHVFDNLTQKTSREIQLIIVGDGNDFETVKALANNHRDIILTGLRTDVGKILTCSDVFVGVSRSALEAMSCEVPVILAGNKDYGQGFIGIFEENKKEQAIATNFCCRDCQEVTEKDIEESILKVLHMRQEEREKLGAYGRSIVEKYYSIGKMVDDAEKMYKNVDK